MKLVNHKSISFSSASGPISDSLLFVYMCVCVCVRGGGGVDCGSFCQLVSFLSFLLYMYTSAKIILLNEWGCRDGMHHAKNHGNKVIPLAILSRILAQSCVTPLP